VAVSIFAEAGALRNNYRQVIRNALAFAYWGQNSTMLASGEEIRLYGHVSDQT
jgi:hypothetical protein